MAPFHPQAVHLISCLFGLAVVIGGSKSTAAASTLNLEVRREDTSLAIKATMDAQSKEVSLSSKAIDDLEVLYTDLEHETYNAISAALSSEVGKLLLSPFESWIDQAEEVNFIVSDELISLPFDLLSLHGTYLFLQKPVRFSLSTQSGSSLVFSKQWSVLTIRDRTADPENGVAHLRDLVRARMFRSFDDASGAQLSSLAIVSVDVLLVSAHGHIKKDSLDYLAVGKQRVRADDLVRFSPRLVYLDSCRLGVSLEFIHAFRHVGTLYYLAPILSNEAGLSSTRTIQIFFDQLAMGKSPSSALYFTRRTLFEEFKDDSSARRLWRSFPFRVYSLN
jgi:hypothetical protein